MTIFETERLRLRKMTMDDVANLLKIFSDPLAMAHYPSTKNEEQTRGWIQWTLNHYARSGVGLWIVERKDDGVFLGQCGIVPQEVDGQPESEIGYLFVRAFWGRGYASEAAAGCRDFGFNQLALTRLISLIAPENTPSKRVAQRIGMRLDKQVVWRDKTIDVYAIRKGDSDS